MEDILLKMLMVKVCLKCSITFVYGHISNQHWAMVKDMTCFVFKKCNQSDFVALNPLKLV